MDIQDNRNNKIKETIERSKFFQTVQAWPLSEELDYEGWLNNFKDDNDKKLAGLILEFFVYYPPKMVKQMLKTSVGHAGQSLSNFFPNWKHEDFNERCIFSAIPGETPNLSDSGNYFTRILKELGIPEDRIVEYKEIPNVLTQNNKPTPVIFVDDFVGSGSQVDSAWNHKKCTNGKTLHEMAKNDNHLFVYAPIIVNHTGYNRIKRECTDLILSTPHILGPEYNLFNESCFCWKNDATLFKNGVEMILRKSNELGIPSTGGADTRDQKGFGEQGLALMFAHGAPDAVPAFFYWCDSNWTPLFQKKYER